MAKVIFDPSDFNFATNEEQTEVLKTYPRIRNFGFQLPHEIVELMDNKSDPHQIKRSNNLYWWDLNLVNKLGKLRHSYVGAAIQINRGLISQEMIQVQKLGALRFQFNFYSETAYYYYFSARDTIFQIINLYLGEPLEEHKVTLNSMREKKLDLVFMNIVNQFQDDISSANNIRNAFVHRFPPNAADHRSLIEQDRDKLLYLAGTGKAIGPADILNNLTQAIYRLAAFIEDLRPAYGL